MSFKAKAKTSEGDFEHPPGGTYPAVWVGLINLGTQQREFNGKKWEEEKIYFLWELVGEHDSKGKPFIVSNDYTFSLHEKANLRKMVEGYYGKPLGPDQELDLMLLIGKPCILSLSEGLSAKQQKYVEIVGVQRPMKGQTIAKPETPEFVWDFDLHQSTGDPEIPEWVPPLYGRKIVDEIKKSPEWARVMTAEKLMPASKTSVNGAPATAAVTADAADDPIRIESAWRRITMNFRLKTAGGARAIDRVEVARALQVLIGPGEYHELRGLGRSPTGETWAHSRLVHWGDWEAAVDAAYDLSDGIGIYYSLNPVRATLGDRGASAKDILSRRWLLVDVDRTKVDSPDDCATEGEREDAHSLLNVVCGHLVTEGWPSPVIIDSGNGGQCLWRIDLPADTLAKMLLSRVLHALRTRWIHPRAEIDPKVFDAPRIARLPGTWNRKGVESAERPYRLAKLLWVPDGELGIVTVDQLHALASSTETEPSKKYDPWKIKTPGDDKAGAYVRSAVERELAGVVLASAGNRNDRLNTAAFSLGQFVGGHHFDRAEAERQLHEAGRRTGLGDSEIDKTIASGLDAGIAEPRTLPPSVMGSKRNGAHTQPVIPPGTKLTIRMKDVRPEKVDWFYENRLAPGFISIFAGRTGFGKSFVTCDIVAKLSFGKAPPFSGIVHSPMRTLFISEDSPALVIVPRLIELGADENMIDFMRWETLGAYTLADTDLLERAYQECGCPQVVVIDPPSSFLGDIDEHRNAEIRGILKLLTAWLDTHRVACIFITHISKRIGKELDSVERIIGSVAWGSVARMTLAFVKDPDVSDQYVFGGTKNNLGPLAETLAYKFIKTPTGITIEWIGKVDTNMEDAMNSVKKKSRGLCAVEWLADRFREKVEWESDELVKCGRDAGISRNALFSPEVNALPIKKRRRVNASGDSCWFWIADSGWPVITSVNGTVGTVGTVDDKPY